MRIWWGVDLQQRVLRLAHLACQGFLFLWHLEGTGLRGARWGQVGPGGAYPIRLIGAISAIWLLSALKWVSFMAYQAGQRDRPAPWHCTSGWKRVLRGGWGGGLGGGGLGAGASGLGGAGRGAAIYLLVDAV